MKRESYNQRMRKILQNFTVGCVKIHKNDPVSEDVSEDHVFAWFLRVALDYCGRHYDHEMLRKLSSKREIPWTRVLKDLLFKRYQKYSQHKDLLVDSIFMSGLGHVLKDFLEGSGADTQHDAAIAASQIMDAMLDKEDESHNALHAAAAKRNKKPKSGAGSAQIVKRRFI